MSKYSLETENVNKIYGTTVKQQVLYDINLQFEEKTFNSIIGQSGSGKSTILNIIGTLDKPTTGAVKIAGRRVDKMSKKELSLLRNQQIGFIFQFHYLLPEFTILENVLMPYRIKHRNVPIEIKNRALELLEAVELENVSKNKATAVSGGQAQRAAIARALLNNPKIILADEPTGNLDSESTAIVYKLLRNLNEKYDNTFVVITHDPHVAEKTDRIIEIKDGRVIKDLLT